MPNPTPRGSEFDRLIEGLRSAIADKLTSAIEGLPEQLARFLDGNGSTADLKAHANKLGDLAERAKAAAVDSVNAHREGVRRAGAAAADFHSATLADSRARQIASGLDQRRQAMADRAARLAAQAQLAPAGVRQNFLNRLANQANRNAANLGVRAQQAQQTSSAATANRRHALARVRRAQRAASHLGGQSRAARSAFRAAHVAAKGARGQVAQRAASLARGAAISAGVGAFLAGAASAANMLVGFGVALGSALNAGRLFAESMNEQNKRLARFNPAIAGAYARQSYDGMRRDIHVGQAVQGTTVQLARSVTAMRDAYVNFDIAKAGVLNRIGIIGAEAAAAFGRGFLDPLAKKLTGWMDGNDPEGAASKALGKSLGANLAGLAAMIADPLHGRTAFKKAWDEAMKEPEVKPMAQPFVASLFAIAAWGPLNPPRAVPRPH